MKNKYPTLEGKKEYRKGRNILDVNIRESELLMWLTLIEFGMFGLWIGLSI